MSRFQKIKNFGPSATVVSYAYFQAFKFPDSMNVHFQCVIQVCRFSCPEPQCAAGSTISGPAAAAGSLSAPSAGAPHRPFSSSSSSSPTVHRPAAPGSYARTPTSFSGNTPAAGSPSSFGGSSVGSPSSYTVNSPVGSSSSFRGNAPPPPPLPSNSQGCDERLALSPVPRLHLFIKHCQLRSALVCSVGKWPASEPFAHTADACRHQLT